MQKPDMNNPVDSTRTSQPRGLTFGRRRVQIHRVLREGRGEEEEEGGGERTPQRRGAIHRGSGTSQTSVGRPSLFSFFFSGDEGGRRLKWRLANDSPTLGGLRDLSPLEAGLHLMALQSVNWCTTFSPRAHTSRLSSSSLSLPLSLSLSLSLRLSPWVRGKIY